MRKIGWPRDGGVTEERTLELTGVDDAEVLLFHLAWPQNHQSQITNSYSLSLSE